MRKAASIFSILFGIAVLAASDSKTIMAWISGHRQAAPPNAWWGERPWDMGDLNRMGYLEGIARFRDTIVRQYARPGTGNQKIDLYLTGDSYVKDIPDTAFYGLHSYHFVRRYYADMLYRLDSTRTNILLIETSERFAKVYLANAQYIYDHVRPVAKPEPISLIRKPDVRPVNYALFGLPGVGLQDLFNPSINQNIEYNLFSYNCFTPIRAFKAEMTANLFRRASGDVVIADDGSRLLFRSTVKSTGPESTVAPLENAETNNLITQLNEIYDHYRKEGFSEVYLSIIPSPASMLQPYNYNQLVPEIQKHLDDGSLKMPLIDVYSTFQHSGAAGDLYLRGDTHWSERGKKIWIGKVNTLLHAWDSQHVVQQKRW